MSRFRRASSTGPIANQAQGSGKPRAKIQGVEERLVGFVRLVQFDPMESLLLFEKADDSPLIRSRAVDDRPQILEICLAQWIRLEEEDRVGVRAQRHGRFR